MIDHAGRQDEDSDRRPPVPLLDRESLLDWVREANEQLVVSAMKNQALAEEAAAARADAETANRLKDEFLAMVSHELRTPLSAVLGCARLLARGQLDPDRTTHAIHVIERNSKAAARIIDDLLDVSRIGGGHVLVDRQPVDLGAVIREALDAVSLAAEANAITVTFTGVAVPTWVAGDALRLTEIVENLLSNALKFTPRGGDVDVHLSSAGAQAEIHVADSGHGIAPELLPRLFERFVQGKTATARGGGIGLGLPIVKALVEAHGGSVHADSPGPGKGATFTVRLPMLSPRELVQIEGVGVADATVAAPVQLDGVAVLLVEDDADARGVLRLILEIAGAKVEAVGSVREALRAFDGFRPDVLVSDIGMPDEDGYALIRHLRAREADGGHVPAIALTGYVSAEDRARLLAAGFQTHLRKPVDPDTLEAAVASLASLGRR